MQFSKQQDCYPLQLNAKLSKLCFIATQRIYREFCEIRLFCACFKSTGAPSPGLEWPGKFMNSIHICAPVVTLQTSVIEFLWSTPPAVTYGHSLWRVKFAFEGTVALQVRLPDPSHILTGSQVWNKVPVFGSLIKLPPFAPSKPFWLEKPIIFYSGRSETCGHALRSMFPMTTFSLVAMFQFHVCDSFEVISYFPNNL